MKIIQKIISKLENTLKCYQQTKDIHDLVFDIEEIITDLTIGYI